MNEKVKIDQDIARRLRRTWPAFFGRYGRLTEVQRQVIPSLLDGCNLLVGSATASGKTEAACAPVLERLLTRKYPWKLLYISPTRALVNDLYQRLDSPCYELGCSVARRTGDHREALKPETQIIITTPESFDSLLCRGKIDGGHVLADVAAVIMDEIHLLFGTARGKQLQWLLKRLQRLRRFLCTSNPRSDDSLQLVCLSATLPEPELVAESFLGNEHHIVTVPGSREIVTVSVDSCNPAVESVLPAYAEQLEGPEKILVFCNRKKRVDGLAGVLKKRLPAGFSVYAHHGNLGRSLREKAEKALKMEPRVVLVATSTLEIGIDIGDVDLIVLDGPPPDVSSLLQRIGRGNRRTNMTRVMMCSNNYREVIIHSAMLEAAINGDFVRSANKTNYGVIIQQVASYIFQSPKKYRTRGKLLEFVDYCETGLNSEQVLDSLIGQGEFSEKPGNVISLGKEWLERSERGAIHSNIENAFGISVRDGRTGEIFATGINVQQKGSKLSIGGNLLSVRSWRDRVVDVKNLENPKSLEVSWNYFSNSWVDSDEQPYCVRKYLDISEDEWPVFSHADKLYAFHFGGVRRRLFLEMAKTLSPEPKAIRITNWFVSADNFNQLEQLKMFAGELNQEFIEQYILNHIDSLEKKLGRPVINKRLPDDLRRQEILSWMGVAREKQSLRQVRLTTPTEPEVLRVLKIFVQDS